MSKDLNITFVDKNGNPLWVTFTFSETGQKITYTDIYLKNNSHVRLVKSKYEDGSVVLSRDYANDVLFDNEKDMNEYIKEQFPFTPYSIDMENGIISVYEEPEREISGAHPSDSLDNVVKNYESFDEEDFVVRDKETGNYIWFLRETGGGIEVCYFDKDYNKIEPFIKESGSVFSSMKSFVTASLSDKDLSQMEVVETLMFKPFAEQEWFTTESKNLYLKYKTDFDAALKDVKDINAPLRVCDVICDFNKNTSEESPDFRTMIENTLESLKEDSGKSIRVQQSIKYFEHIIESLDKEKTVSDFDVSSPDKELERRIHVAFDRLHNLYWEDMDDGIQAGFTPTAYSLEDQKDIIKELWNKLKEDFDSRKVYSTQNYNGIYIKKEDDSQYKSEISYNDLKAIIEGYDAAVYGSDSLSFVRPKAYELQAAFEEGYPFDNIVTGYDILDIDNSNGAKAVLTTAMCDRSDADSARQWEKDTGGKLLEYGKDIYIADNEDLLYLYPDTKENRKALEKYLLKHPFEFNWDSFTKEDFDKLVKDVNVGMTVPGDILGSVFIGAMGIEIICDYGEGTNPITNGFVEFNLNTIGKGSDLTEFDKGVPHEYEHPYAMDYVEFLELLKLPYEEFKTKVEDVIISKIISDNKERIADACRTTINQDFMNMDDGYIDAMQIWAEKDLENGKYWFQNLDPDDYTVSNEEGHFRLSLHTIYKDEKSLDNRFKYVLERCLDPDFDIDADAMLYQFEVTERGAISDIYYENVTTYEAEGYISESSLSEDLKNALFASAEKEIKRFCEKVLEVSSPEEAIAKASELDRVNSLDCTSNKDITYFQMMLAKSGLHVEPSEARVLLTYALNNNDSTSEYGVKDGDVYFRTDADDEGWEKVDGPASDMLYMAFIHIYDRHDDLNEEEKKEIVSFVKNNEIKLKEFIPEKNHIINEVKPLLNFDYPYFYVSENDFKDKVKELFGLSMSDDAAFILMRELKSSYAIDVQKDINGNIYFIDREAEENSPDIEPKLLDSVALLKAEISNALDTLNKKDNSWDPEFDPKSEDFNPWSVTALESLNGFAKKMDEVNVTYSVTFPCGFTYPKDVYENDPGESKREKYRWEIYDKIKEKYGFSDNDTETEYFRGDTPSDSSFNINFAVSVPLEIRTDIDKTNKWVEEVEDFVKKECGCTFINWQGGERYVENFPTLEYYYEHWYDVIDNITDKETASIFNMCENVKAEDFELLHKFLGNYHSDKYPSEEETRAIIDFFEDNEHFELFKTPHGNFFLWDKEDAELKRPEPSALVNAIKFQSMNGHEKAGFLMKEVYDMEVPADEKITKDYFRLLFSGKNGELEKAKYYLFSKNCPIWNGRTALTCDNTFWGEGMKTICEYLEPFKEEFIQEAAYECFLDLIEDGTKSYTEPSYCDSPAYIGGIYAKVLSKGKAFHEISSIEDKISFVNDVITGFEVNREDGEFVNFYNKYGFTCEDVFISELLRMSDFVKYGSRAFTFKRPDHEQILEGIKENMSFNELKTGYSFAGTAAMNLNKPGLENIEQRDVMNVFGASDHEAALQWCIDTGKKLLEEHRDIWIGNSDLVYEFPDTEKNRECLKEYMLDKPVKEKADWEWFRDENFDFLKDELKKGPLTKKSEGFWAKIYLGSIAISFEQKDIRNDYLDVSYGILGNEGDGKISVAENHLLEKDLPYNYIKGEPVSHEFIRNCENYKEFQDKLMDQIISDLEELKLVDAARIPTVNWDNEQAVKNFADSLNLKSVEVSKVPTFDDDIDKMYDFDKLSKDDFLASYDYLSEEEYDATAAKLKENHRTGMDVYVALLEKGEKPSVSLEEIEEDSVSKFDFSDFSEKDFNKLKDAVTSGNRDFIVQIFKGSLCIEINVPEKGFGGYSYYNLGEKGSQDKNGIPYCKHMGTLLKLDKLDKFSFDEFKLLLIGHIELDFSRDEKLLKASEHETVNWNHWTKDVREKAEGFCKDYNTEPKNGFKSDMFKETKIEKNAPEHSSVNDILKLKLNMSPVEVAGMNFIAEMKKNLVYFENNPWLTMNKVLTDMKNLDAVGLENTNAYFAAHNLDSGKAFEDFFINKLGLNVTKKDIEIKKEHKPKKEVDAGYER